MNNILAFIIFWIIGIVIALLGNKKIREYKDYGHPKLFLIFGILLSVFMSWAFVISMIITGDFSLPDKIYHNCYENSSISYEELYLDENGNKTEFGNHKVHNTYKVYTCRKCGKTWKEQLQ